MKNKIEKKNVLSHAVHETYIRAVGILLILFLIGTGCNKDDDDKTTTKSGYEMVKLVSDYSGNNAGRIDANLVNAWGVAIGPTGGFWVSSNGKDRMTFYDRNGNDVYPSISLHSGAKPTGVVYNSTASFMGYKYLMACEDGKVEAWAAGMNTTIVIDRSTLNSSYKGLAIANNGGKNYLYLANFSNNHVDVFDENFNSVSTMTFNDGSIPAGFAPFNIYNHDGKLWVAYAKQVGPGIRDDSPGLGNGYINIFNPDGSLYRRFASQGTLNSPWAIVDAPSGFGLGDDKMLIGNFGDGRINIFNSDGTFNSQLKDGDDVMYIEGLWALAFPENGVPAGDQNQLFFTAGTQAEAHGLFGYLKHR